MTGLCSASDRLGFVQSRNRSKQWTDKLITILRLKTSVKLHIDQMMRTRNFRVRNEVVERGSVTKDRKGKKTHVERIVGECFSGRHMDNVPKETHVVSVMTKKHKETCAGGQRRKGRWSSLAPNSKAKTDEGEEKSAKKSGNKDESSSDNRSEIRSRCKSCKKPVV